METVVLAEPIAYPVGRPKGSKNGVKTQREPNFVCECCGKKLYMPLSVMFRHGVKRRFCSQKCRDNYPFIKIVRERQARMRGVVV